MKFKGLIATDYSGSMDGVTASHNAGGMYLRRRAIPVNSNTSFQQTVRNALTQLTSRWGDVLTQTQRDEWASYAIATPLTDALGEEITLPPLAMYTRCNVPRLQAGLAIVDDGPEASGLPSFSEPGIDANSGADQIAVDFATGDSWVDEDGAAMLVYASRAQALTINYFKGPYRFAGSIVGDSGTPPTSPANLAAPFPIADGLKTFTAVRITRADGRLSGVLRFEAIGSFSPLTGDPGGAATGGGGGSGPSRKKISKKTQARRGG